MRGETKGNRMKTIREMIRKRWELEQESLGAMLVGNWIKHCELEAQIKLVEWCMRPSEVKKGAEKK